MKQLFLAILSFISLQAIAQNTIQGKVTDENNAALSDVSVKLDSTQYSVKTDNDGFYKLTNLPDGTYKLVVKETGYITKRIEDVVAQGGKSQEINITLAKNTKKMKEAVVKSTAKKETVNSIITFQKNNITVSDGVSAEAIKRTPDRNVSDVLRRASGMSLQGEKFAVIRGMDGRYVNAMINNVLVPSTEPDRKAFAFDLIPANIIDNIVVTKAAVPELTGEFAGGIININLKEGVEKPFMNIAVGTGFNSQTLAHDFATYKGSNTDALGFDNKSRSLPNGFPDRATYIGLYSSTTDTSKYNYSKQFNNNWSYNTRTLSTPNISFQVNGGTSTKLAGKKLNSIFSLSYSNNYRTLNFDNIFIQPNNDSVYKYTDNQFSNKVQLGALANFSYNVGKNSKIMFKNLFNLNSNDQTTLRFGRNIASGNEVKKYELYYVSNRLINSQLHGEHKIKSIDAKIKWGLNYSNVYQNTPDRRVMEYTRDASDPTQPYQAYITTTANPLFAGRFYSNLNEVLKSATLDVSKEVKLFSYDQKIKIGTYVQSRNRTFDVRNIGMAVSGMSTYLNPNIQFTQTADSLFAQQNLASNGFVMAENTNKEDAYNGKSDLSAFYIQFENQFSEKVKLVWGVRDEMFKQSLNGVFVDSVFVSTTKNDLLPSAVLTYSPDKKTNIRVCASQTVVRPEFRELAPFQFYDFERNSYVQGNTTLIRSKINNLDARYEYYPSAGEMFVVGAFYKYFKNPIQPYLDIFSGGTFVRSFYNAAACTNMGLEAEFRKKLEEVSKNPIIKNTTLFANATYTKSKVEKSQSDTAKTNITQLVNQSPFILNAGFTYMQPKKGWSFTATYNLLTRRISEVGITTSGLPDITEATRNILDAQIAYRFNDNAEIKFNMGDMLNQRNMFFMDKNGNYKYDKGIDYMVFNRVLGRNFSIQYNHKL